MRSNKGLGRSFSRRLRLERDARQLEKKLNKVSPHHTSAALKEGRAVERPRKVVITERAVVEALKQVGLRNPTGLKRRHVRMFLVHEQRDSWT